MQSSVKLRSVQLIVNVVYVKLRSAYLVVDVKLAEIPRFCCSSVSVGQCSLNITVETLDSEGQSKLTERCSRH